MESSAMPLLAGITFRQVGKLHYYPADGFLMEVGTCVVAETEFGQEYGEVKILRTVEGRVSDIPHLYRIVRVATESDKRTMETRLKQADEGMRYCQERVDALYLPMKLVEAETSWDGQQMTFYFVAEARVDFRQLVKEVAAKLKMRIHLHQVGARDHAKTPPLLYHVSARLRSRLHEDGKGPEPLPQPVEIFRGLR
jgi:cell fate regulator YaaT (PSP1 superfamily)